MIANWFVSGAFWLFKILKELLEKCSKFWKKKQRKRDADWNWRGRLSVWRKKYCIVFFIQLFLAHADVSVLKGLAKVC